MTPSTTARTTRPSRLAQLHDRLDRIYAPASRTRPGGPRLRRRREALPHAPRAAGGPAGRLRWDAEGRTYETISGVLDYSARVAAAVGAMMTALMGVRDANVLARACDLGTAMQLTNICRDVGEDARNGRIYLPLAWLREAGIDPEAFLADPRFTPALGEVVKRVLALADTLYNAPRPASPSCRWPAGRASTPRACCTPRSATRWPATATIPSPARRGAGFAQDGLVEPGHCRDTLPRGRL
jgi:phytoene synthase